MQKVGLSRNNFYFSLNVKMQNILKYYFLIFSYFEKRYVYYFTMKFCRVFSFVSFNFFLIVNFFSNKLEKNKCVSLLIH